MRTHRDDGADHNYTRDALRPEWHGFHAARRGIGSNLNRLGVDDTYIQKILRHSNVSTTQAYYIKGSSADMKEAMKKLEAEIERLKQLQASLRPVGDHEVENPQFVN